jgi:cobaltochelatase CobT
LSQEKAKIEQSAKNFAESETETQMLSDEIGDESEFDNHTFSAESYIEEQTNQALAEQNQKTYKHAYDDEPEKIDENSVCVPFTTAYDSVKDLSGSGSENTYKELRDKVFPMTTGIRTALERALIAKENRRIVMEQERGMINTRSLYKVVADKNFRRPFQKFARTETKKVAVQLVTDLSGSMSGNKVQLAIETGAALAETLKLMNIPFECVGFNTGYSSELHAATSGLSSDELKRFTRIHTRLNHMIFKSFDSNNLTGIASQSVDGANNDGESLIWAGKRLALRPEPRKIMIVLSDGQPACEGDGWKLAGNLRRVVKLLTQSGIEPFGVGIRCDSPKHFYPNWIQVNELEELPKVVVSQFAQMLLTGANKIR